MKSSRLTINARLRREIKELKITLALLKQKGEIQQEIAKYRPRKDWDKIVSVVATIFGTTPEQIKTRGRHQTLADARQLAMFLIRQHSSEPTSAIGKFFKRDHSTVVHACHSTENKTACDKSFLTRRLAVEKKLAGLNGKV